jgi:hypothetical protein
MKAKSNRVYHRAMYEFIKKYRDCGLLIKQISYFNPISEKVEYFSNSEFKAIEPAMRHPFPSEKAKYGQFI